MTKKLSFKYEILLGDPEPQHKEPISLKTLYTYTTYILLIFARFGRASTPNNGRIPRSFIFKFGWERMIFLSVIAKYKEGN